MTTPGQKSVAAAAFRGQLMLCPQSCLALLLTLNGPCPFGLCVPPNPGEVGKVYTTYPHYLKKCGDYTNHFIFTFYWFTSAMQGKELCKITKWNDIWLVAKTIHCKHSKNKQANIFSQCKLMQLWVEKEKLEKQFPTWHTETVSEFRDFEVNILVLSLRLQMALFINMERKQLFQGIILLHSAFLVEARYQQVTQPRADSFHLFKLLSQYIWTVHGNKLKYNCIANISTNCRI